jgi:hypothetical protein
VIKLSASHQDLLTRQHLPGFVYVSQLRVSINLQGPDAARFLWQDPTSGPLAAIAAVLHEAQHNVQQQQQQQQQHQEGSATGLPAPPSAADSGAPGSGTPVLWHAAALQAPASSLPSSPANQRLDHKVGPAHVRASSSCGSVGATSAVHMVGNGVDPGAGAPPCSDGIDGGLTAEDVARLQRRLADFGVSD